MPLQAIISDRIVPRMQPAKRWGRVGNAVALNLVNRQREP